MSNKKSGKSCSRLACLIAAFFFNAGLAGPAGAQSSDAQPSTNAEQAPPIIPTSAFAARSEFRKVLLSPDGHHVALSTNDEKQSYISIYNIEEKKVDLRLPLGENVDLRWFRWAGPSRLLIGGLVYSSYRGMSLPNSRTLVLDLKTRALNLVGTDKMGFVGDDVLYVDPDGAWILLSLQTSVLEEPEVWRMSLDRGPNKQDVRIQNNKTDVWNWFADDKGIVRLGLGRGYRSVKVWYRSAEAEELKVIGKIKEDSAEEDIWDVLRIINDSDEGYVLRPDEDDRMVLRRFNYATRDAGEVIYRNDDWDLTDFELDKDGKPVAVYFSDDRDRVVWLDEEIAKTQAALERALGGLEVWIAGRARDRSRMLVWAGGPSDPGAYYLYTPAARSLEILSPLRPDIDRDQLAPTKAVKYDARDGTSIHAMLTLPRGRPARDLPLIVLPHGGPYGIRDKLDYSDEVQLLANRGYAVLQPNFRGSGGYGEAFSTLGAGQIGRAMQDDLDDGMSWAVEQGIADPDRVCLMGSSYGGYAAMWGIIRNPERYRCAISFAGVSDWKDMLRYDRDFMTHSVRKSWQEKIRGADEKYNLDLVSPLSQAKRLTRPLLIAHGEKDGTVPFSQFEAMQKALKGVRGAQFEYLTLEDSGHGFYTPKDEQAFYDRVLGFLARHNPTELNRSPASGQ